MQLTRFDRWLRERFVYETHIQTLRLPEEIPARIQAVELPEAPGKRYRHLFIAKRSKDADELIQYLKEGGQMYSTQIVDREAWYVPFIAPKDKSVTWWIVSVVFITIGIFYVLLFIKGLTQNPEFQKNFSEALEILKG